MLTARENFIRFLKNEPYEYIPTNDDTLRFLPSMIPCYTARGIVSQQEPYTGELGGKDCFGVDWYYDPAARGSMEKAPLFDDPEDLEDWESKIIFPDLSKIDWEGCAKANAEYLNTDKIINSTIFSGFFERLISILGFENAAMALIDEEQQDYVHRLFDALADYYIDFIAHFKKHFNVELFTIHDDWGTQISTMFSVETHTEMILPYVKKVVDGAHALGVFVEQHSCGKIEKLVPNIIASGADTWRGQAVNNKKMLVDTYGDKFNFAVDVALDFAAHDAISDDKMLLQLQNTLDLYKDKRVWFYLPRGLTPAQIELAKSIMYR